MGLPPLQLGQQVDIEANARFDNDVGPLHDHAMAGVLDGHDDEVGGERNGLEVTPVQRLGKRLWLDHQSVVFRPVPTTAPSDRGIRQGKSRCSMRSSRPNGVTVAPGAMSPHFSLSS